MKTNFVKYERKDNKDLCEITLENDAGMAVKVLNYGATLEKVLLDGENMILSLNSPEDYSKERNFWAAQLVELLVAFVLDNGSMAMKYINCH